MFQCLGFGKAALGLKVWGLGSRLKSLDPSENWDGGLWIRFTDPEMERQGAKSSGSWFLCKFGTASRHGPRDA